MVRLFRSNNLVWDLSHRILKCALAAIYTTSRNDLCCHHRYMPESNSCLQNIRIKIESTSDDNNLTTGFPDKNTS